MNHYVKALFSTLNLKPENIDLKEFAAISHPLNAYMCKKSNVIFFLRLFRVGGSGMQNPEGEGNKGVGNQTFCPNMGNKPLILGHIHPPEY